LQHSRTRKSALRQHGLPLVPTPQIINNDNSTPAPSLLLVVDAERYLFNCGEGFQRLATEYKVGGACRAATAGLKAARVPAALAQRQKLAHKAAGTGSTGAEEAARRWRLGHQAAGAPAALVS
jgi:hypothetical protein